VLPNTVAHARGGRLHARLPLTITGRISAEWFAFQKRGSNA
jgi:hypothetical protein